MILPAVLTAAGLAALGALVAWQPRNVGPRLVFAAVAVMLAAGSAVWLISDSQQLEQRRAIEARLAELRAQGLASGSTLACLESVSEAVDSGCEQTLFAAPEALAAASVYRAAQFDLLADALKFSGPRDAVFERNVAALRRSLQEDRFGLLANVLAAREGCSMDRCDLLVLFNDPTRIQENLQRQAFDQHVVRHAGSWRALTAAPASTAPASAATVSTVAPTAVAETKPTIPDKYVLPSAASIPPVSIMDDEPKANAAAQTAAKGDPSAAAQPAARQREAQAKQAIRPSFRN